MGGTTAPSIRFRRSGPFLCIWTSITYIVVIPKVPLTKSGLYELPYPHLLGLDLELRLLLSYVSSTSGIYKSYVIKATLVDSTFFMNDSSASTLSLMF